MSLLIEEDILKKEPKQTKQITKKISDKQKEINLFINNYDFQTYFKTDQDKELLINKNKYVIYLIYFNLSINNNDSKKTKKKHSEESNEDTEEDSGDDSEEDTEEDSEEDSKEDSKEDSEDDKDIKDELKLDNNKFQKILILLDLINNYEFAPIKLPYLLNEFSKNQIKHLNKTILFEDLLLYPITDYTLYKSVFEIKNIKDYSDKCFITKYSKNKIEFIDNIVLKKTFLYTLLNNDKTHKNNKMNNNYIIKYIYDIIEYLHSKKLLHTFVFYKFIHIISSNENNIYKLKWFLYHLPYKYIKLIIK